MAKGSGEFLDGFLLVLLEITAAVTDSCRQSGKLRELVPWDLSTSGYPCKRRSGVE